MIRSVAIVVVSTILGVLADWRIPQIDRFLWDVLRSTRPVTVPGDIVIVAIDEPSIARLGPFPWPRTVAARTIDAIAVARPKVIALDVLYVDPMNTAQDSELARSIAKAGNVVVAAQLMESPGANTWLLPLPEIERAAAAVGHINVLKDAQGIERELAMRPTDDKGRAIYPMAVEAVRAGKSAKYRPTRTAVMTIDFIGPAGSFSQRTYSLVDVIDGRVPAGDLRDKYVLIGATATSLGGRVVSDRHGRSMPGVEALANAVNTIVRERFYSETQNLNEILYAFLIAAMTVGLLSVTTRFILRIGALLSIAVAIVVSGYIAYTGFLVYPAWTAEVVSFACAAILALLWRYRASRPLFHDPAHSKPRA
jgi:CHASE2 domain-containing sensor protein